MRLAVWRDTALLLIYCGLIFFLSSRPVLIKPDHFPNEDKLFHATGYAIMAWFAWRAFTHSIRTSAIVAIAAFLFASMYGISDEWHQSFVPQRDSDIWDWVADSIGGLCSVLMLYYLKRAGIVNRTVR